MENKTKHILLSFSALLIFVSMLLASCGEDRTHEYVEKTQHNFWMYEQMSADYYWSGNLTEPEWKEYFATPTDFFGKLTAKGVKDNWSYIIIDTVKTDVYQRGNFNHKNSYGFDFALVTDPTGETTKTYARVVSVFEGSPADVAGLQRNDYIETFDGFKISQKNQSKLVSGTAHTFSVRRLSANADDATYVWSESKTVEIGESRYVEDKAFPFYRTIPIQNGKVGYVMINRLTENAVEDPTQNVDYKTEMDGIIQSFRSSGITDLILDFRLCNFGSLEMARRLATYVIPDDCIDKVFAKTTWNEANSSKNETIKFDSSLAGKTLGMKKVYVITSSYTKGAAEWVIMSLKYALGSENVILMGSNTAGQNMLTQNIGDYDDIIHLYPAVAEISDGNGATFSSYSIDADNPIDELSLVDLNPYGDLNEYLLYICLYLISNQ